MPILLLSLLVGFGVYLLISRPFARFPVLAPIVTSPYGERVHPVTGERRFHNGTDFRAATGTPLVSIGHGRISKVATDATSGTHVIVSGTGEHAGWSWSYSHLSAVAVEQGENVAEGEIVGYAGATGRVTGPHLHFVVRRAGVLVDPMTVLPLLGSSTDPEEERHA